MDNIFIQLAVILGLSSLVGLLTKYLKLPLLIAYILVGLILSLTSFLNIQEFSALSFLPEIGIAFMLFLVGMELDLREIRNLGRPILVAGILQIVITSIIGASLARLFNFGPAESWYLGVGLAFSSTVVVVKLLLDKNELTSLFGKLSLGILLLEDLLAVLILLALTVSPSFFELGYQQAFPLFIFLIKVFLLFALAVIINRLLLSKIFKLVSDSVELLFLTALAWCFIYVSIANMIGFSTLIGAFLAGLVLATSPYHFQIQSKIKPLRDFFVALFFVYLGTQVNFSYLYLNQNYLLILFFTVYALLAKPIIFLLTLGIFGFRKHTMFATAINLSQISEFSLILLVVGLQKDIVSPAALTTIALTGVLTIIASSVMITNSRKIYRLVSHFLSFFERKNYQHFIEEMVNNQNLIGHVVIVGGHRVGGEVVKFLKKEHIPQIILDFNPHQVQLLLDLHLPVLYGDMGDPDVLEAMNLKEARMVISTAPNVEDNRLLLEELKTSGIHIPVVVRAETVGEAQVLYKAGADFVIIPEVLAGDFLVEKLKEHLSGQFFKDRGKIEMERLSKKTLAWE